jgi:hypothetical protein
MAVIDFPTPPLLPLTKTIGAFIDQMIVKEFFHM